MWVREVIKKDTVYQNSIELTFASLLFNSVVVIIGTLWVSLFHSLRLNEVYVGPSLCPMRSSWVSTNKNDNKITNKIVVNEIIVDYLSVHWSEVFQLFQLFFWLLFSVGLWFFYYNPGNRKLYEMQKSTIYFLILKDIQL